MNIFIYLQKYLIIKFLSEKKFQEFKFILNTFFNLFITFFVKLESLCLNLKVKIKVKDH